MIWEDDRYNTLPVRYGNVAALPASRSQKTFYPRVVIQPKADNTGVAWAAVWNARTAIDALLCNQTDVLKITSTAFSPAYNYGLLRKQPDCQEAISIIDLLESMVRIGSPYFSEFREYCPSEVPLDINPLAGNKKLSGYFKLYNTSDDMNLKVRSVKSALVSNHVVLGGMICPSSFLLAKDFWQPHEQSPDQQQGGHAVCIVGYDDSKFGGAFEILNTWGKDWGVQGYTWIRYKDFADYFPYAFGLFQSISTSCDVSFEGSVAFHQINGEEMNAQLEGAEGQYKFWKPYPTGTTFTIQVNSNIPAYIYCFGIDPYNNFFPLFPRTKSTVPVTFSSVKIPDDMPAVTLTDPPGKNNIYFIFSSSPFDLNNLIGNLKGRRVVTPVDIQMALAATAAPVKWSNKGLSFSGSLKSPVVMQVLLEQVRK